jgi:hypothetical protein
MTLRSWNFISDPARPASYETTAQRWLWRHNQIAVFVLVAVEVLALLVMDHTVVAARYGPYAGRVYGGAIALASIEVLLWHFLYRHGGTEARWAAGLMGVWFGILILVQLTRVSIDGSINVWSFVVFGYMTLSHAGYALFGSRARH